MLITAGASGPVCFAQTAVAAASPKKNFSVGFLREGSDIPNAPARMEELRALLRSRYAGALTGYGEIVLSPCDGPRDMIQRAIGGEFDLVFATAMVYAQLGGAPYEPILQLYQPGDYLPPTQDSGALRQGVIFVGPRSPLFSQKGEPAREELRKLLQDAPLAVASAESAVGYLSPRYIMLHDLGLANIPAPLFCDSDAEVIKHVVSGLAQVGACRSQALEELFPPGRAAAYVRVLRKTYPLPTDPILLRQELMPSRSDVGVVIKRALREDFLKNRVANASPRNFEIITKYLQELKDARPGAAASALPNAALPNPAPPAPNDANAANGEVPAAVPTPAGTPLATPDPRPVLPPPAVQARPALPTPAPTPAPATPQAVAPTPAPRPALPTPSAAAATPQPKPALPAATAPLPGAAESAPAPTPAAMATPAPRPALPGAAAQPAPPVAETPSPRDKPTPALPPAASSAPPPRPTPLSRPAAPRRAAVADRRSA